MTYIPVGTRLTYTATIQQGQAFSGFTNWEDLASKLKVDLPNLPGMEEFDVENVSGNDELLHILQQKFSMSMIVLNNGVDHGAEQDVQSIIDGTIQGYGNQIVGSNITNIKLPDNPDDGSPQIINTGAASNLPPPSSNTGGLFSGFSLSGGSIAGISVTLIVIVLIIAVLLLPGNARKLIGG